MNDEKAFLTAILEQPDDDSRKLIYADWLEERGDPRGEFLRLMIQTRRERTITPDQRQRHRALSDELAELRSQEVTAITARYGYAYANPAWDDTRRQNRIEDLERQLLELSKQIHQDVPARLQELAATFDPVWLSVVSDPEIEGCGRQGSGWLRFEFVCDKTWADLTAANDEKVRHCQTCNKNVYFCDTIADAREHSQEQRCIAVDLGIVRRDDDLTPRMAFAGQPSKDMLRKCYEEDVDAVSQARLDARKKKKRTQKR